MKKLLIILITALISFTGISQSATFKGDDTGMRKSLLDGVFEIELPGDVLSEDVEKHAGYYTSYFSVDFDATTNIAKIIMVENTPSARRVINRFLLSNGVKEIDYDGKKHTLNDFYSTYLK